jgi:16S rRNA (cytidine1402-2'-O)-methyltransferase
MRSAMAEGGSGPGRLAVCPTPIGNLDDVTLRVLTTLREADVVACEDTRHTRVLLDRHAIRAAELVSLHEHNEAQRAGVLAERVLGGAVVALVSDAGMPLISDPGYATVRACLDAGARVEVLPGPSAVVTALVASGLGSEPWRFAGFLPRRRGDLERAFGAGETTVCFESPRRVAASLAVLAELDPDRPVAVCRELTKIHEQVLRGRAADVAARLAEGEVRGEVVLVFGAADAAAVDAAAATAALRRLVEAGARARPAAGVVAELTGVPANALYRALTQD